MPFRLQAVQPNPCSDDLNDAVHVPDIPGHCRVPQCQLQRVKPCVLQNPAGCQPPQWSVPPRPWPRRCEQCRDCCTRAHLLIGEPRGFELKRPSLGGQRQGPGSYAEATVSAVACDRQRGTIMISHTQPPKGWNTLGIQKARPWDIGGPSVPC
jgi:hypothetical protein